MSTTTAAAVTASENGEKKGGELLYCGTTAWDTIGKKKGIEGNLVSPTRLKPLLGVDICYVAAGCASVHCVALDVNGRCYTWGRNDKGQLGHGDQIRRDNPTIVSALASLSSVHCVALDVNGRCYTWGRNDKGQLGHGDQIRRDNPTIVSALASYKIVKAASGRSHTIVMTEDGLCLGFGWNKHGQLGTGSARNEIELYPVRCLVTDVTHVACGADFTVWLTSVEGATILGASFTLVTAVFQMDQMECFLISRTAGLPQYGQLGHGTDNEYNTKDSSVKLAYEAQPRPKAISAFANETIVKVACGSNHTVAVDSNGYVYTWGYGGYGRLGHREQKDEFSPRRVDVFTKHNLVLPGAVVSAGSVNSSVTAGGGQMYMWGKIKSTGDDSMYPKPLMDLSGWNIRCMDSGSMHHFVGADSSCISWGLAQSGELGYGPHGQKSSAIPKKVEALEGMHVLSVACGLAHSLVVVDRTNVGDQLDELEIYDGKPADEGVEEPVSEPPPVKQTNKRAAAAPNKRKKKSEESSDTEDDGVHEEDDNSSDSEANGFAEKTSRTKKSLRLEDLIGLCNVAPKKGGKPVVTKKKTEKVVNPLFEKRPKLFGIGGALPPKKDVHRFVRWPQVVRIQRKRRILKQRLKVPPALNQFTKTLDKNLATTLFKMLLKYRPEDKAAKKERLVKRAQAESEGKTVEAKKPIVVKYGLNHITYLIEQNKAQLVIIAHDVDPIELVVWLPALCRKMEIPYCIVKGKSRLGTRWQNWLFLAGRIVHQKTAAALCLTTVKNEDKMEFSRVLEAIKANFNDKYEEYRKKWGGGIMGSKSQAKTRAKEKVLAKEAAQRMN
ncbi:regulator of chromosome condensation (RCC1) family protein [Artemisia annua]|uniref:Regulator of chromosome condensation (RCC1) family protein n=1 Tax=Artemisia annua TaxID=35608 RepID=A0A2U1P401_ARTAN|nr:regulator of chromosome condensation (RCC1) family protein [Artemisia annua]